jgi:hypothetical protein
MLSIRRPRRTSLQSHVALTLFALVFAAPARAGSEVIPVDRHGDIQVTSSLRLGDTVLKEGRYELRAQVAGTEHVVVVYPRELRYGGSSRWRPYYVTKPEIARVPCAVTTLPDGKVKREVVTRSERDGRVIVSELRLRSEKGTVALVPVAAVPH